MRILRKHLTPFSLPFYCAGHSVLNTFSSILATSQKMTGSNTGIISSATPFLDFHLVQLPLSLGTSMDLFDYLLLGTLQFLVFITKGDFLKICLCFVVSVLLAVTSTYTSTNPIPQIFLDPVLHTKVVMGLRWR